MSPPTAPQIHVRPKALNHSLQFNWQPPVSDGGSAVTSYFLSSIQDSRSPYFISSFLREYTVGSLANGSPYTYTLAASNAVGLGAASTFRTVQPGFKPQQIITPSSTRLDNGTAQLTWSSEIASLTYGYDWASSATTGTQTWQSIAGSSDGLKLIASAISGIGQPIWTSSDSGTTWTNRSYGGTVPAVASAADGVKVALVNPAGVIRTSTDGGVSWTDQNGSGARDWKCITSSADGSVLIAGVSADEPSARNLFISTDSGVNWSEIVIGPAPGYGWKAIACSANGSVILASPINYTYLWRSTDGGTTWADLSGASTPTSGNYKGIAVSPDGTKLAACKDGGYIWTSTDSGATWTERTSSGSESWVGVAISADGTRIAASAGSVFKISTDGGVTWRVQPYSRTWTANAIAMSYAGDAIAVPAASDYIFTATKVADPNWVVVKATKPGEARPSKKANVPIFESSLIMRDLGFSTLTYNLTVHAVNDPGYSVPAYAASLGTDVHTWVVPSSPPTSTVWTSAAASSDASKMYITAFGGSIWKSADSGANWTSTDPTGTVQNWLSVACSADGSVVIAGNSNYPTFDLYRSTDSGSTWSATVPPTARTEVRSIVMSGSGNVAAFFDNVGSLAYSTDAGVSWTDAEGRTAENIQAMAISSNAATFVANNATSNILIRSTDTFGTYTVLSNAPSGVWSCLAVSDNGTAIAGSLQGSNLLQISRDTGNTWSAVPNSPYANWKSVKFSSNASSIVAVASNGDVWSTGTPRGLWLKELGNPTIPWNAVAGSASLSTLLLAGSTASVYVGTR